MSDSGSKTLGKRPHSAAKHSNDPRRPANAGIGVERQRAFHKRSGSDYVPAIQRNCSDDEIRATWGRFEPLLLKKPAPAQLQQFIAEHPTMDVPDSGCWEVDWTKARGKGIAFKKGQNNPYIQVNIKGRD